MMQFYMNFKYYGYLANFLQFHYISVYDDVEGDGGQNKMMVGSMNAASKFTKGEGEEEQLGGTVYTKNLRLGMKMPEKIIEGRNNWLLMEKDPEYEEEDMGENCASNFEHCNEMTNVNMPRDFLAKLTQYFFRVGGDLSFFQEAQREASEIMSTRRPHWRKRKAKSASLFLSIFFLIEKEVSDSSDNIVKELFVEAFSSRDEYIDLVMKALDRVDEIEAEMKEGKPMKLPNWTFDTDIPDEDQEERSMNSRAVPSVDVDRIVMDTLNVIEGLDEVERSKYVKIFRNEENTVAIQHTKVKSLAKEKGKPLPKFLTQRKNYPLFVTLKTETFTKLISTGSRGASNTCPGFCTSITVSKLALETKQALDEIFGMGDEALLMEVEEHDDSLEMDPGASQDYPMYSQSQSKETLKVCNVCNFKTRSKLDFQNHTRTHPKCTICSKVFPTEEALSIHTVDHKTVVCSVCNIEVQESNLASHMESHNASDNYRLGLTKSKAKKTKTPSTANATPRLNSFHVFCRAFREDKKKQFPQLNMLAINKLLRDDWHLLTDDQKAAYKPTNQSLPSESSSSTPVSTEALSTSSSNVASSVTTESSNTASAGYTQSQIIKCGTCGRLFLDEISLREHKLVAHGADTSTPTQLPLESVTSESPTSDLPGYVQSQISKCKTCGKLFLNTAALKVHIEESHDKTQNETEIQLPAETEESSTPQNLQGFGKLFWLKVKNVMWPCKSSGESEELIKVEIFNDLNAEVTVDVSKLKPFKPISRIPRARTAEWRRGYERALASLE